jgi:DNA ligase (NAD+)
MTKNQIINRVNELNKASEAYYNTGQPIMSDAEFDNKLEELRQWEEETGIVLANSPTHNVGAIVLDSIDKITHESPMLSLAKCHSAEDVKQFSKGHTLVGSVKLDGLTCRLIFKDGELIRAESRGNGTIGNIITDHVKQFLNVPLHINKEGTYIIDGEALIKTDDFEKLNKNGEYKTPRNLASGTLGGLDTSVVKNRKLRWYAWEVVEGSKHPESFASSLMEANDLGFETVPFVNLKWAELNIQEAIDFFLDEAEKENLPQDGVVFKYEDVKYGKSLGSTSHHFNNGIAFKVFNESVESELINIEYTMGRTGILTPTAVFKPIEIEDTIVERASLHNISIMKEIMGKPWVGQHVGVIKSNLIIPQIRWAEQDNEYTKIYIDIPHMCPICGQPTKIVKDNNSEVLVCTNDNCNGKLLGKLSHSVSRDALNIDGLSEATIEKFINLGWLSSIQDIYHLLDHENEMKTLDGFGKKSVDKLLVSIEKSRKTSLERFLYSLSIPLLGKSASMMIADSVDYDFDTFIDEMTIKGAEYFRYLPGVGDSLISSLNTYWKNYYSEILQLANEFTFETQKSIMSETTNELENKTFVITGSVKHYQNRDTLKADIEAHGGKVVGSVSSKVNYLINNDINSTSSKNKKAKSLNIPIISEDEFLSMLNN